MTDDVAGRDEPGIVRAFAPDDVRQFATGTQAVAHCAQSGDGIDEEHRAEAGEDEIECRFLEASFDIALNEANIADIACKGLVAAEFHEGVAAIDANDVA